MKRALALCLLAGCAGPGLYRPRALPALPEPGPSMPPEDVRPIQGGWYPVDAAAVAILAGERAFGVTEAALRREAALVAADQARRGMWPTLQPAVRYFQLDGHTQATEGAFVDVDKQSLAAGVGLTLSLDIAESRARALEADRTARAEEHASEAARRATVLEALELFDDLIRAQNEIAIQRELFESARSLADYERARARQGSGLAADKLRSEAEEARAEGDVLRAEALFKDASTRLGEVLRIGLGVTLFAPEPVAVRLDYFPEGAELEPLVAEALERRPEVAEALYLVEAAERAEKGARRAPYLPRIEAGAYLNAFGPNFGDLDDQETLGVGLVWDLSPERFGRRRAARLDVARRKLSLAHRRESIAASVARHVELARVSRQSIRIAERRLDASLAALNVVRERREQGSALVVEVLDAQREVALARAHLLAATLDHNRAQRRLHYAVGRDES